MSDGSTYTEKINFGDIRRIDLPERQEAKAVIYPKGSFDIGAGEGHELETTLYGGVVGIVLDARGRPLSLPEDKKTRDQMLLKWWKNLELYSFEKLDL